MGLFSEEERAAAEAARNRELEEARKAEAAKTAAEETENAAADTNETAADSSMPGTESSSESPGSPVSVQDSTTAESQVTGDTTTAKEQVTDDTTTVKEQVTEDAHDAAAPAEGVDLHERRNGWKAAFWILAVVAVLGIAALSWFYLGQVHNISAAANEYANRAEKAEADRDDLKAQLDDANQHLNDVTSQLEEARSSNEDLQSQLDDRTAALKDAKEANETLQDTVDSLADAAQEVSDTIDEVKNKLLEQTQKGLEEGDPGDSSFWQQKKQQAADAADNLNDLLSGIDSYTDTAPGKN